MDTRQTEEVTNQERNQHNNQHNDQHNDQHNQELAEKDRRYVWHAMARHTEDGPPAPMMAQSGQGAWISNTAGNRYLDGMSGLWCVNAGYGREELAKAAYDQLVKLPYYPLTGSHEPAVELGEKLNRWLDPSGTSGANGTSGTGGENEYVIFYSNSGGPLEVRLSVPGIPRQWLRLPCGNRPGPAQVPLRAPGAGILARTATGHLPLRVLWRPGGG